MLDVISDLLSMGLVSPKWKCIRLRQPFGESCLDVLETGVEGKVFPLMRIAVMIVEFFVAIGISNIAPPLGAQRMITPSVSGPGGNIPIG